MKDLALHVPCLQGVPLGQQNAFVKSAMATCDHPSDLLQLIEYPSRERKGTRKYLRVPELRAEDKEYPPVPSSPQRSEPGDIFQDLIVSGAKSRPRNLWATIGSVSLQSFLLMAVVVIPLFHTDPLPIKRNVTMLYLPPPPAASGNSVKFQAPRPVSYTATSSAIPNPVRKTQEAPATPGGPTGGVVGGIPNGVAGGIPGGIFGGVLSSTPSVPVIAKMAEPTPVKRIRVASRVAEANLIHDVPPQYPPEAGRARVEGAVVLLALIGRDGTIQDVRVESGLPILAKAAIDAVKQWRYKPYMIDGEPVEVDSRITINFTLSAS
jgi:protein TonB